MSGRRDLLRGLALATSLLLSASALPAQTAPIGAGSAGFGSGVHYQHFTFGDAGAAGVESLSLLTVPVAARAPLLDGLTLDVGTRWARAELTAPDGSASTVEGFTDTNVTASLDLADGEATIAAVAALPTGKSSYTVEEMDVAGVLASDLLPFRVSNLGSGGGFGLRASTARDLGAVDAALSVGFFRSGEFDPVEGELVAYRPGDNLSVRAALAAPAGAAGEIGLQVGYQHYGDDQLDGTNLFRPGDRIEALGTYSFALGSRSAGFLYGGYHRRSQGTHLQGLDPVAGEDLLLAGGGLRLRLGSVLLRPSVDGRMLERDESSHDGWQVRAGARAEWRTGSVTLIPTVRGHLGSVTLRPGAQSDVSGVEAGLTLRLGDGGGSP